MSFKPLMGSPDSGRRKKGDSFKVLGSKSKALEAKKGSKEMDVQAKHIFSGLKEDKEKREKHWREAKRPPFLNN